MSEDLLLSFGCPAELSLRAEEGRERMRRVSRGKLAAEKIEAVLGSARQTIGVPCVAAEPQGEEQPSASGADQDHKRGSGPARRDLYLAIRRLIQRDEIVKMWFENKVKPNGGRNKQKIVVALIRKLSRAGRHELPCPPHVRRRQHRARQAPCLSHSQSPGSRPMSISTRTIRKRATFCRRGASFGTCTRRSMVL